MPRRTEANDWAKFFGLLVKLAPSPAVHEAARSVFGMTPGIAAKQEPADRATLALMRMLILHRYEATSPGVSSAQVYNLLKVHKSDWYRWKRGELPESSSITKRIEGYLIQK